MLVMKLLEILDNNSDASLHIMLPSGEFIPDHFHVTEVGYNTKSLVDCGGKHRWDHWGSLQVWTANDVEHRLIADKLSKIIKSSDLQHFLHLEESYNIKDLHMEIEYGSDVMSRYSLANVEITPNGLLFVLSGKKTDCLAPDKCGVNCC